MHIRKWGDMDNFLICQDAYDDLATVATSEVFFVLFKTALYGLVCNRAETKNNHLRHHDEFF